MANHSCRPRKPACSLCPWLYVF
ncbi:hypothetical protein ACFPXN_11655 [Flavobacterium salmonis]